MQRTACNAAPSSSRHACVGVKTDHEIMRNEKIKLGALLWALVNMIQKMRHVTLHITHAKKKASLHVYEAAYIF